MKPQKMFFYRGPDGLLHQVKTNEDDEISTADLNAAIEQYQMIYGGSGGIPLRDLIVADVAIDEADQADG